MNKRLLPLVALFAFPAAAHFPTMECALTERHIECKSGFSDGTGAPNYVIQLFDYEDNLIERQTSDQYSNTRFTRPEGEFYLVFDAGHEAPVEIDIVELL
ncbi:hypothetical protein OPW41_04155 [Vibrio europaeus]|uniref:hypothetical protein n=1 Tax=Vibrio europaeus TaxID=300876 RepID=UPI00148B88B2|nr:hypothetical protein [Vibrio europaeus]MDC5719588.1 hypothetical protein [Vibrio europaeus]MDC5756323.1 hypothetical protein [Vibrio europaeus]MDC5774863.1 hypothetical protein [Vibrio europaeus]MDC5794001.1 hypothetical protein [Vibrio europaeus]MDC5800272.1 hypothetical protein [Vibrio europaeus]